jgi:hypothetical protein
VSQRHAFFHARRCTGGRDGGIEWFPLRSSEDKAFASGLTATATSRDGAPKDRAEWHQRIADRRDVEAFGQQPVGEVLNVDPTDVC